MKVTQREDGKVFIECSNRQARQIALTCANKCVEMHGLTVKMMQEGGVSEQAALVKVFDHLRDSHNEIAQLIFDEVGY